MAISLSPGCGASLLVATTENDAIGAAPLSTLAVATSAILWFGGQRLHSAPGIPAMTGFDLSTATRSVRTASTLPARSRAWYVMVETPSAEIVIEPPLASVPLAACAPAIE